MPFSAACPSCGAPVEFKSASSFHAVCSFCRSTLVRESGALNNLGRMAELLVDGSPLQLGSEGRFKGVHFALIGRIQLQYAAGMWNEWHILFDNMRTGWLSDANGEYVVTFLTPPEAEIPPFAELFTDGEITLAGRDWVVTNREEALCIAGEGELPFAFGAGYPAPLIDLRVAGGNGFASIDYSETPPLFFAGEAAAASTLAFANLRNGDTPRDAGPVKNLTCPQCGNAITVHDAGIQRVACASCLTVLDAEHDSLKILRRIRESERVVPLIPLGSCGRFGNQEWTVIGFMQRAITYDGIDYLWQEYLLHHPTAGLRWLVESSRHWSWVTPLSNPPRYSIGLPSALYDGEDFVRFSGGEAKTLFVLGEFNWKVTVDEVWETLDFIAPPRMLSREGRHDETTWSLGEYLSAEDVATAFKMPRPLPPAATIGPIQPNPRGESHARTCRRFWQLGLLALVLQLMWVMFSGTTLIEQKLAYSDQNDEPVTTPTFRIDRMARSLALRHDTNLNNNWVGLNIFLVERSSGRAWATSTELSYWHGVDDGESWSEGNRKQELVFRDVAAGEYYLVIDPELLPNNPNTVVNTVRLVRDPVPWSNFVFLMIFLAIFPLLTRYRVASFETSRWADADYAQDGTEPATSFDDDSGDDD